MEKDIKFTLRLTRKISEDLDLRKLQINLSKNAIILIALKEYFERINRKKKSN